jgi:hypothetical protein
VYVAREAVANAAGGATEAAVNGENVGAATLQSAALGAAGAPVSKVLGAVAGRAVNAAADHASILTKLVPYGSKGGGGHHPISQAAMAASKGYDPDKALAIPLDALRAIKVDHGEITKAQRRLYQDWRAKNPKATPTWADIRTIETQAMVDAKMDPKVAAEIVDKAIKDLQSQGVGPPTRVMYDP